MQLRSTLLATVVALAGATGAHAQSWGFTNIGHWAEDIAVTPEGGVWAVGLGGDDPLWMDISSNYVIKLDPSGEKVFGGTPDLTVDFANAYSVMPTTDGGAIVYCTGEWEPLVYKLDATGALAWESAELGTEYFFYGGKAAMLNDGRVIVGGLTDFEHTFYEVSNDGELLSTWTVAPDTGAAWGWSYYDYKEAGIMATADGGFLYATGNYGNRILMKYNSDLELDWTSYFPWELEWEYGYHNTLSETSDGGYLFAGSGTLGFNYYGTLRKINADGEQEWFGSYNHAYDWEEGAMAEELGSGEYIIWTQNAGDQSTHGWVLDPATGAETGSIFIPVITAAGGFGATGVEIWDTESAADGGYYLTGRMYLYDFEQRIFVIKSNADGTFPPCIFDCVWPGDANNDGYANGDDLFEIGINYGAEGSVRDDMTIDWSGKLSAEWYEIDTTFWYVFSDLKYTDCNGNGVINDDDTTAVINNMGLEHPLNPARLGAGDIPLYFAPTTDYLSIGLNEIPIMLGDEINSVEDLYGLTFTISVDGESIDMSSLKIVWEDSWIGNAGETLTLSKNFGDAGQVVGTNVRKTRTNVSGDGQVGTLQIVVVDNISGKVDFTEVELSFTYANAIQLNREVIPLAPESITLTAEEGASVETETGSLISVFPNPAQDMIYFNFGTTQPDMIRVNDLTGRTVMTLLNADDWMNGVNITTLATGQYVIEYQFAGQVSTEQFMKQ